LDPLGGELGKSDGMDLSGEAEKKRGVDGRIKEV
jgi:hypothetical protein